MAINDFVRRSIQIVGGGIAQSTTDYFDNAISFVNDAKEVIDMGKQMGSDGAKKFNELKSSGILKKTRDWFYNEGGMFGDFDFDDDDFDAGFEIDSADSESSTDSSKPLSKDMMTDIAKKQTGAMYKAFGRQADLHIANTAEIISTINTRTAELTASVNNVNNTLIQIGKRLDLIVEWTAARTKKEEEEKRVAGILDYGGGISLTGVVNKAKETAEDSMIGTFLSIGKTMLGSGMMTPETVMSMILSQTILEKKWDKLGGKSINDIGEFINDTVGEVIQNTMTKVLTSKNEILESLFEDIITRSGRKNYQNSVKNTYNDKPAVFDGMTRKSIITVIPGYLNEILKAVSKDGVGREVDSKGNLTKKTSNSFVKEVADSYFRSGTMELSRRKAAADRTSLTETEVAHAVRTLTGCWVWYMYRSGRVILEVGEVKNILAESTRSVVNNAAYMMATADPKHRSEDEWKGLYQGIIEHIDEFKYRQELQRSAERADKNLETFARSHVNNHQAKTVDESVILQAFRHNYRDFNRDAKFRNPSEAGSTGASPTAIGSVSRAISITELDYMAGIFDRLNRGLNVFITGQSDHRKKKYSKINMIPGYAARKLRGGGTSAADDSDEGGIAPVADKLKDALSHSDKKKEKMDDATREAYEAKERGEELSKEQEKLLKEHEKNNGLLGALKRVPGKIKSGISHFADESRKEHFVDPNARELSEHVSETISDIKKKISDAMPDFIKEKFGEAKKSKAGKAVSQGVNTAKNKGKDLMLGQESMNEKGQYVRTGGVIHAVAKPISSIGTFIGNTSAKFMTTKHLNEKVNSIFDQFKEGGSHAPGGEQFNAGSNDYMHVQILSSMADAAMANGEVSNDDKQMMYKQIAAIDDKDVQKRLKQYLVPLMERNSKSKDKTAGGEQKSPLGKLGSMLLSAGKLAFGGIFVYVKGILKTVFATIKYGMKAIFKFAKWGIARGLRQIKYGAKSMFEGFKQVFKPLTKGIKHGINIAYKAFEGLKDNLTKGFTKVFSGLSERFSKWNENRKERKAEREAEGKQSLTQRIGGIPGKISEKKTQFIDKLTSNKNGFAAGFFKARNDRKEAEAKAKLDEESKPIVQAMEQSGVGEIKDAADEVANVLKDESEIGKGFMKPILKILNKLVPKEETPQTPTGDSETPQMEDIQVPQTEGEGGSENEGTQMPGVGNTRSTDLGGNNNTETKSTPAADAGGDAGGEEGGGLKNSLGKILGGMSNMMGGLLNIVLSIVMSLEGVKMIMDFVMNLLTESLKPLNEAFQALMKAFKPVLKQIGGIIKQLAEFIVVIVDAVMDVIKPILTDVVQPILEVLSPLLQAILGAITPILKIVGILLKVIMAPLMGLFKFVLLPILKIIGDAVQIIMGVLQIGFGLLMMGIGGIIAGIGGILSLIGKIPAIGSGAKKIGSDILDSGKNMMSQGKEFVIQGGKSVAQGAVNLVLDYASLYTLGATDALLDRNGEGEKKETKQIEAPDENTVESTYANGDITNIYNTYGGEYQRGMGGYLNMDQRGCGPIALADMYNRNSSGRVSARSLAGSMFGSGTYDPSRGTSVGDYIDTARGMGMNVRAGRVTQQSLKSASPTNPITVVGSGSDYGTRKGNNHFMNVIGTDSHGGAYVSNPLTGRIDRKPASTVAGSAVMGIYGSGDEPDGGYTFPDAIKDAFKKLKEEANKILGLFSMEKSDEEETDEIINSEKKKEAVEQAKKQMGKEYDKYSEEAKAIAFEDYKRKYPQKDNESDEEYQKKFDDWWDTDANQAEYLARTELLDAASKNGQDAYAELAKTNQKFVDDYAGKNSLFDNLGSAYTKFDESLDSLGSSGEGGNGYFTADTGAVLFTNYKPKVTETKITGLNKSESPLHEFFSILTGGVENSSNSTNSSWYGQYNGPDSQGVGHSGSAHGGIDFNTDMATAGDDEGKPLLATTSGTVTYVSSGYQNGLGNSIQWKDNGGYYHWYLHMQNPPSKQVGDEVSGGEELGKMGNTGRSQGSHLHYSIHYQQPSNSDDYTINPLFYFKNYNPNPVSMQGKIDLTGKLGDYSAWSAYSGRAGVPTFINAGKSAGMSGAEIATIASTGIWEDGGEKIFGIKSLSDTTYDYNGQAAKGIMNWVDQDVNYGDTVLDQLKYIHNTYFDKNSSDWRAIVRDNGFVSQDTQAFKDATGRSEFKLNIGDRYGPYADQDLIEGSAWFFMDALGPAKIHTATGMAENVGTAAEAYNWMIDNGYVTVGNDVISPTGSGSVSTGYGMVNSAADGQGVSNVNQIGTWDGKNTGTVITNNSGLNMRDKPSTDGKILIEIPKGTKLNLETSGSKDWFKTSFGGKTGYVSAHYISLDKNEMTDKYVANTGYSKDANADISSYLDAYAKTARLGASDVKTSEVVQDFQNYLMNNEGMTWSDIVDAGNELYKGTWNSGDPLKLWLWARDNYGKTNNNNNKTNNKYDYPIGPQLTKDNQITTPITTNGGSGMYNTNNSTITTTTTTAIRGSGDMSDLDFWDSYLGWNNKYANSNITTPVGEDIIDPTSETYYDEATGTTVVNTYNVTRGEDKATEERLRAILANTYNVRSESMEALLNAILEELKKRRDPRGGGNNTNGSTKLFDERIPSQVTRLSVG